MSSASNPAPIEVHNLTIGYSEKIVQKNLNFTINRGDICIIMGGSGCGKSTLMRHLVGLQQPLGGDVMLYGENLWQASSQRRDELLRRIGVMYQGGALWSSMTLFENIEVPLKRYSALNNQEIRDMAIFKLALVGLADYADYYPSEISGGMQKRASIARALALDPEIVIFDEPSAGLDPLTSRALDEMIVELRESLKLTFVVVTHELPSIFAIGTHGIFLDAETKTMIAEGKPSELVEYSDNPKVRAFLTRGKMLDYFP